MIFGKVILLPNVQFFLEVYIIFNVLMWNYEKKKYFYWKQVLFILISALEYFMPSLVIGVFNFNYLISVLLCLFYGFFLYKVRWLDLVTHTFASFALQNIQSNIFVILTLKDALTISKSLALTIYFITYFSSLIIYIVVFRLLFKKYKIKANWITCITSSIIIVLNIFLSQYVSALDDFNSVYVIYEIMCNIFALLLHYGVCALYAHISNKKDLEQEKNILLEMIYQQEKLHKVSKETVDIINHKCHDLKHQIIALENMSDNERNEQLEKIKDLVNVYGRIAKTGNETLDLILTEKNLLCKSKNIVLKYIVDATCLERIKPLDIWTIFGNAIDNAIEALEKEDENKRVLTINICWKNKLVFIELANYTSQNIVFKNGIPVTSKNDKNFHGFGVKSIINTVEKYQGACKISCDNNCYKTQIII